MVRAWLFAGSLLAAQAALPPLSLTFSMKSRFQRVRIAPYSKMTEDTTEVRAVSEAEQAIVVTKSQGDGRTYRVLSKYDAQPGDYMLQPFFDEETCYKEFALAGPFRTDAYKRTYGFSDADSEGFHAGEMSSALGTPCRLYHFSQSSHSESRTDMFNRTLCLEPGGVVLHQTTTHEMMVEGRQVFWSHGQFTVQEYNHSADPARFRTPSTGCVDLTTAATGEMPENASINDPERVRATKAAAAGLWEAGANEVFEGMTLGDLKAQLLDKRYMGASRLPLGPGAHGLGAVAVPRDFDARQHWPACGSMSRIRDQGACGSCFAFAAADVLADRACIGGGAANATLSVEYILSCNTKNFGCGGGYLDNVWWFLRDQGVPEERCQPYQHHPGMKVGACPATCRDGSAVHPIRAASAYAVAKPGDVATMQLELLTRGSFEVAFFVFSDLWHYKSGVYSKTKAAQGPPSAHAVRMLGWGEEESSVPYWRIANSWGTGWGMGGFLLMRRGTNECGVETQPAAGEYHAPDLRLLV